MDNLLSYCGLVDARLSSSKKDLPVRISSRFVVEQEKRQTLKDVHTFMITMILIQI